MWVRLSLLNAMNGSGPLVLIPSMVMLAAVLALTIPVGRWVFDRNLILTLLVLLTMRPPAMTNFLVEMINFDFNVPDCLCVAGFRRLKGIFRLGRFGTLKLWNRLENGSFLGNTGLGPMGCDMMVAAATPIMVGSICLMTLVKSLGTIRGVGVSKGAPVPVVLGIPFLLVLGMAAARGVLDGVVGSGAVRVGVIGGMGRGVVRRVRVGASARVTVTVEVDKVRW